MKNVIIFGASGQLGNCLKAVSEKQNLKGIIFPHEKKADILDTVSLGQLFKQYKPEYVINCAAFTAVDKAEVDLDTAQKINAAGAENLAKLCRIYYSVLIHISTDFVFKGDTPSLLTENDEARPINVYGQTKLEGERAIIAKLNTYFILRTSWLYSEYGNNFVKTMLKFGIEKKEIKIIADQIGTPTYAIDLAEVVLKIVESDSTAYGVYHYSNEGVASWYDFTKAIFDIAGIKTSVLPIGTQEYLTPARRPKFSVMDKTKIKNTFNINIPYWRDSLVKCINILQQ